MATLPAMVDSGNLVLKLPPLADRSLDRVLGLCRAVARRLTGDDRELPVTTRLVEEQEIPDDRPTQTPVSVYVREVRVGEVARFEVTEEVGGWSPGTASWRTADFAGRGPVRVSLDPWGVELAGARAVVEAFAEVLAGG